MPRFNVKIIHTLTGQREDIVVRADNPDLAVKEVRENASGPIQVIRTKLVRAGVPA